jgi:hypothetical protein
MPGFAEQLDESRLDDVLTFEGQSVTRRDAQVLLAQMVPGSDLVDAVKRIARARNMGFSQFGSESPIVPVPPLFEPMPLPYPDKRAPLDFDEDV